MKRILLLVILLILVGLVYSQGVTKLLVIDEKSILSNAKIHFVQNTTNLTRFTDTQYLNQTFDIANDVDYVVIIERPKSQAWLDKFLNLDISTFIYLFWITLVLGLFYYLYLKVKRK